MPKFIFIVLLSFVCTEALSKNNEPAVPQKQVFKTEHKVTIKGKKIKYKAVVEDFQLTNEKDEFVANFTTIAYIKQSEDKKRPITFIFNGGPGSSSTWLHMGFFGPKIVDVPEGGINAGSAPFNIVNNPYSPLIDTDLVFIDPIGTGYSRVINKGENKDYWSVDGDSKSVAELIRNLVTQYKRWNSPKYLAGESYGGIRAALVADELQSGSNSIVLNGIMLISPALDIVGLFGYRDSTFSSYLPTLAATAHYHKMAGQNKSFDDFIQEARNFTSNEYQIALFKGSTIDKAEYNTIVNKLHYFTGLGKEFIKDTHLRINPNNFAKELLRTHGKTLGRLDGRYTGSDYLNIGMWTEGDPSAYGITGAYSAAINSYLTEVLGVQKQIMYNVVNNTVGQKWDWSSRYSSRGLNVMPLVSKAQRQNADFRILVTNGYYDLATPFFAAEYNMNHYQVDSSRVVMTYYHSGHMMYVDEPSLEQMSDDVSKFLNN